MADFHPLRTLDDERSVSAQWKAKNKAAEKRAKDIACANMPSLDHLTMKDFDTVYEPSDDTYLLLDGLLSEATSKVFAHTPCPVVLEIGCGTGVVSTFLASSLQQPTCSENTTIIQQPIVFVTDINPCALQATKATATANSNQETMGTPIFLEAVRCDLISALLPRLRNSVDILIFNPPYVPTPDEEVGSTGIEASWAGGIKGRRVIDRAIPQICQVLARPHGCAYMITVDDNEPEQLANTLREYSVDMTPLVRRRAHNEYLSVQKLTWIVDD